jgi:sorbitol-specific phosphotransferase system component IIBC
MTEILQLFLGVVLLTVALAAYFLVFVAFFSNRITKTHRVINQTPGRSFWVGLVNFLFFGVIVMLLFAISENAENLVRFILIPPAVAITAVLAIILSFGLTGMVNTVGERIFPDQSAWRKTLWGTVILAFACALPFVGWFLLLPYTSLTGIGAVILSFFQKDG